MEHPQQESSEAKIHKGADADKYHARLLERWYFEEAVAFEEIVNFTKMVESAGGKALLVGGTVRDEFMGNFSKDFDVEVYGLRFEQIKELAGKLGRANEVGAFFGIIKLKIGKIDVDLSMPRRESKTGKGHKGFDVEPDPTMTIQEAARRRDFTMNSLAKNILTGEIYDYFGGAKDIQERILKVTDEERFKDDPLRVLRAMQFIGRFGLKSDDKSSEIIRETRRELKDLPKERLKEE